MLQLVTEYSGSSTNKLLPLLITKQKESHLLTSNFTCDVGLIVCMRVGSPVGRCVILFRMGLLVSDIGGCEVTV